MTSVLQRRNFRHHIIYHTDYDCAEMHAFLQQPDSYIDNSIGPNFKERENDTTTVMAIRIGTYHLVVKRYNIRSFWHGVKLHLRPSRAYRSWYYSHLLNSLQIPTLMPVAIKMERLGPLWGRAYFITEYVAAIQASQYFSATANPHSGWLSAVQGIVAIMRQLQQAKLSHPDLQPGNILLINDQPILIDLDYMRHFSRLPGFNKLHQREVIKFWQRLPQNQIAKELFRTEILRNYPLLNEYYLI